ncbi:phosphotransferase [Xylophilus rhododendri]|uniref:Phosphotransferase n=1 Tax=Xylophilus rhododendri TaxID=2697032 RepID=A0A857J111_9BURK|nr:lysylphosphatidylglycerol synthase transmembrane domain-containing protein [Xylophilus rhododendri]QHI96771.1 phosphotransferase [Xylophilus rhododendri]
MSNGTFVLYLLCAAAVLFLAHVVRAARWGILFPPKLIKRRFPLLLGLALGYVANAVVPWRLGELLRAWYASRKTSVRFAYVAATVVAERMSDLAVVAVLTGLLQLTGRAQGLPLVPVMAVVAFLAVLLFSLAVQRSERTRQRIWRLASIFNDRLRFKAVDFSWSLSELVVGGALLRARYLFSTVLMWALYLLSYYLFSQADATPFDRIFTSMLGTPLRPTMAELASGQVMHTAALAAFAGLPIVGVLAYGLLRQWPVVLNLMWKRRRLGLYNERTVSGGARKRFKADAEYDYFLASLFSGNNKAASRFGMQALDDGTVQKLYGGGSDAITALVEVQGQLLIRKFASGDAGAKLQQQQEWLVRHRVDDFPLVQVLGGHARPHAYYYDMPLVVPANDFFDFIHSNPTESSRVILGEVLERMSGLHQRNLLAQTPRETIAKYLRDKAIQNTAKILEFARSVLPEDDYQVNGQACSLKDWELLLDADWLSRQIQLEASTIVHGDLTIENIIVAPQVAQGWYIIDPNPDNVFNSPLIDWGKMLQSLHLGYEGMNRNYHCTLDGSSIRMAFTRSQAYTQLHQFVDGLLLERFGERGLREAYFHELVHYLRLVPYKIRQNRHKGLAFFACASVLLNEYRERWHD